MGLRDRFFTATTARALLSGRLAIGIAVAVALGVAGVPWPLAVVTGVLLYVALVYPAMPRGPRAPAIDPFALSEPWRHFVAGAQRAGKRLRETVDATPAGPLRERLDGIAARLDRGLVESWEIAKRGDQIDETVRRLGPTGLRSKLDSLRRRGGESPDADTAAAIESVESQLATADRLQERSEQTAGRLRLMQTRLDELVARAAEVSIGAGDTEDYAHDVDDLVIELEALRQAVEETR